MKEMVALRVKRTEAGKVFPFDVVYFLHRDLENTLPRIFRSGLVMPITKKMKQDIKTICVQTQASLHLHTFNRNDSAELNESPLDHVLHATSQDLMFVPILFTKRGRVSAEQAEKQAKNIFPLYLTATHRNTNKKNIASLLSNRAYLLFEEQKLRPVCFSCPLHMLAITGQCTAEMEECYLQLSRAAPSTFIRALKKYKDISLQHCEPEIKNGGIHANPD